VVIGDPLLNNLTEAVGYALLVAFLWFVWPPLALLGAGILLVVLANVRAARANGAPGRTRAAITAALTAARAVYQEPQPTELRRVA
jgi:hypothetical protein